MIEDMDADAPVGILILTRLVFVFQENSDAVRLFQIIIEHWNVQQGCFLRKEACLVNCMDHEARVELGHVLGTSLRTIHVLHKLYT